MFKPVSARAEYGKIEEAALKMWKDQKIFQKQRASRQGKVQFSCVEYPKTANRKPQFRHLLGWAFQDAFLRYHTMCGAQTNWHAVWNTQGLKVEVLTEMRLGLADKDAMEALGIERFNEACRRSAFDYLYNWEKTAERLGCWVDWQEAPVTHTPEVIEAVWGVVKRLWENGAIEKMQDVLPYCPRCGTTLSFMEAALGSLPASRSSLYVRLPLADDPKTSLLVHTARPWTLCGNAAAAVNPESNYVTVEYPLPDGDYERLILAECVLDVLLSKGAALAALPGLTSPDLNRIAEFPGRKLAGLHYLPLFTYMLPDKPAHYVVAHGAVDPAKGSGIFPVSPVFGSLDYRIAGENNLPLINPLQADGRFSAEMRPWQGKFFSDAEPYLIEDLNLRGLVLLDKRQVAAAETCPYCATPLLHTLHTAWRLRLEEHLPALASAAGQVTWNSPRARAGLDWLLADGRDWILSRERSWGTPLPLWMDDEENVVAVGSLAELANLADCDPAIIDMHRPAIDAITFPNPQNGKRMYRVPELLDYWFDLGVLPYVQRMSVPALAHEERKQADLLCESGAMIPAWAAVLHTLSVLLEGRPAFREALFIDAGDGVRLENLPFALPGEDADEGTQSTEPGPDRSGPEPANPESPDLLLTGPDNAAQEFAALSTGAGHAFSLPDVKTLLENGGSDPLRWHLYRAFGAAGGGRFSEEEVAAGVEGFFQPLWEIYSFFITFAGSKGWSPRTDSQYPARYDLAPSFSTLILDRWLNASLQHMVAACRRGFEARDLAAVCAGVQRFVEQTSSWYLRHAHQRFWMAGAQGDKDALRTLYYALTVVCRVIAPLAPFFAEELYQNLVCTSFADAPESVHLSDFPEDELHAEDETLLHDLEIVIALVEAGRAVSQAMPAAKKNPRSEAVFTVNDPAEVDIVQRYADIIKEDLGVQRVRAQVSQQEKQTLAGGQFSLFADGGRGYEVVLLSAPPDF